jgi:hypothetical protein
MWRIRWWRKLHALEVGTGSATWWATYYTGVWRLRPVRSVHLIQWWEFDVTGPRLVWEHRLAWLCAELARITEQHEGNHGTNEA